MWLSVLITLILIGPIAGVITYYEDILLEDKKNPKNKFQKPCKVHRRENDVNNKTELKIGNIVDSVSTDLSTGARRRLSNLQNVYFNMFCSLVLQENKLPHRNMAISILLIFWYFLVIVIVSKWYWYKIILLLTNSWQHNYIYCHKLLYIWTDHWRLV